MDTVIQALVDASSVWEASLLRLGWLHLGLAFAYLGAAWLCVMNGHIAKETRESDLPWWLAALILGLLAVNTLLYVDVFVTQTLRSLSKLLGFYGERRTWQNAGVVAMGLLFWWAAGWLRRAFSACDQPSPTVAYELILLLLMLALRLVSAHATDAVINAHLGGVALGRALELLGIGLVLHGAYRCLQMR